MRAAIEAFGQYSTVILGLVPRIQFSSNVVMPFYVYILATRMHGTLYIGVTNDLVRRVFGKSARLSKKIPVGMISLRTFIAERALDRRNESGDDS